ncbi:uncharacterized protein LOC109608727 isoform X2 [Aethina tumida]|uniref:uncharacterized protein LOC109608727 isoform X2 n=1 Tax=Aethina tumida TaxID=116153 RepID=UPI00096AFDEC|nr:uncharacterized protein LOC109608727 isoform X2 [Aethina tumida]
MPNLSQIRNFNLKVIFLIHFTFISLSLMGHWTPSAYLFYNSILILLFLWSIYQDQNEEPLQLAIVVNGCSVILDILLLIMCYPYRGAAEMFSAALCILHLIIRPFSVILLARDLETRSGVSAGLIGNRESYEDIDRNVPQTSGDKTGGYNYATAEQI